MRIDSEMVSKFPDLKDNLGRLIGCFHNLGYGGWHRASYCSMCSINGFGSDLRNLNHFPLRSMMRCF